MGKPVKCRECGNRDISLMSRRVTRKGTPDKKFMICSLCGYNKVTHWLNEGKTFRVVLAIRDASIKAAFLTSDLQNRATDNTEIRSWAEYKTNARDHSNGKGWRKLILDVYYPVSGAWPADMRKKFTRRLLDAGYSPDRVEYHSTEGDPATA